jgi:hypothetical protein
MAGEIVNLMRLSPITPDEDLWYSLLLEAESTSAGSIVAVGKT